MAKKHGFDMAVCGHTHKAEAAGDYFNSGCWTEKPCTFLEVRSGAVEVKTYDN
jgi:UDP-2,3-diacylglucosamine pyrophosphatase LpxH